MMELTYFRLLVSVLRARRAAIIKDEGGYTTETVVITAFLVGLAIVAVGIIAVKVTAKANDIQTG